MKTKLVLKGIRTQGEQTEKVLLAFSLAPKTNKLSSWIIQEKDLNPEFVKKVTEQWIKGIEIALPEDAVQKEILLDASTELVDASIKLDQTVNIERTKTQWMAVVLSTRLYESYHEELEEMQQKVDALSSYSKESWETMKTFWSKVQGQADEKLLEREHVQLLKDYTNEIFNQLKKLRADDDAVFETQSSENATKIRTELDKIEANLANGNADLFRTFDALKKLQKEFKDLAFTRNMRSKLWNRIDKNFKILKEKRAVVTPDQQSRLTRRIEGLTEAIRKMTQSINRDQRDYDKQIGKLSSGRANLLETQLREVRGKLIKDRLDSKQEKLDDMNKTMGELQKRMERYNTALTKKEDSKEAPTNPKNTVAPEVTKVDAKEENDSADKPTDNSVSDESAEA